MPKGKQDPYRSYDIDDWKWEFIRRNLRYIRAYEAIEWLKRRKGGWFRGFGLYMALHPNNLKNQLQHQLSLRDRRLKKTNERRDWFSLPSPLIPAHEYEYSPVELSPILGVWGPEDFEGYSSHPDAVEPAVVIPEEHQLAVVIDNRCSVEDIVSGLKAYLPPFPVVRPKFLGNLTIGKPFLPEIPNGEIVLILNQLASFLRRREVCF